MSRVVWTRSLCETRPRIHRVGKWTVRPANAAEMLRHGFLPEGRQRAEVATTGCGIAHAIWLVEPDRFGGYGRSIRWEGLGVSLLDRHADAISGRRCKKCWPEPAAEATS